LNVKPFLLSNCDVRHQSCFDWKLPPNTYIPAHQRYSLKPPILFSWWPSVLSFCLNGQMPSAMDY
jgi:hypothetical protein